MYGPIKRDQARKLEPLTEGIGAAAAGLLGAIDDILKAVKEFCSSRFVSFDDVVSYLSDTNYEWYKRNSEKLGEDEGVPVFMVVSQERIKKIFEKGYSEEAYDYACEGSGRAYGEYILRNFYEENLDEEGAKELAVYTILETSKMDPSVGEDINMLVFRKEAKCVTLKREDIDNIKLRLAPLSRRSLETQNKMVEAVVEAREEINNLWERTFGFRLFRPNEKAVFQILKPCRTDEEFTNNIAALALLVDQLNIDRMRQDKEKEGSVNILEEFLKKNVEGFDPEIVSSFRDIMALRSKRFPIHVTDTRFVETVIKMTGRYPPQWSDLWLKTLEKHKESIDKLLECLRKKAGAS
jgi:hypothetical protein